MTNVNRIDLSGAYGLEDLIKGAQNNNTLIYVLNENQKIHKVLENVNFIKHIGRGVYFDSREVLEKFLNKKNYSHVVT